MVTPPNPVLEPLSITVPDIIGSTIDESLLFSSNPADVSDCIPEISAEEFTGVSLESAALTALQNITAKMIVRRTAPCFSYFTFVTSFFVSNGNNCFNAVISDDNAFEFKISKMELVTFKFTYLVQLIILTEVSCISCLNNIQ